MTANILGADGKRQVGGVDRPSFWPPSKARNIPPSTSEHRHVGEPGRDAAGFPVTLSDPAPGTVSPGHRTIKIR